jgi:cell division protein FtsB
MRWLTLILAALIIALQYPLWLGKGSWLKVWEVDQELKKQQVENERLKVRNTYLDAEVKDLKTGYEAIEERARSELGMVKQDEVFFQVIDEAKPAPLTPAPAKSQAASPAPQAAAPVKDKPGQSKTQP